jgi:T1SS-143 domain-containing protein
MTIDEQNALLTTSITASALSVGATGVKVSLDETAGLQNLTTTPSPAGDADDNDTLVSSLPSTFTTRLATLGAGTATGAALSGYTGANAGSDAFTISGATSGTDISFVGSTGAPLNGFDSGLDTLDGSNILLYTDTVNNNILLGRVGGATGAIVFAAYIEETGSPVTGGKIWTVEYQPLKHPGTTNPDDAVDLTGLVFIGASQNLEFSLKDAPSGQNLFLMFTTANPTVVDVGGVMRITDPAIIATGKDPANQSTGVNITTGDTINTSQAGGPTTFGTNNQMITEQEGIRFSFVSGARQNVTIPNLDQNEADVEANADFTGMVNVKTVSFDVVQLQSGKSAVVKISAFTTAVESGTQFIDGYGNDTKVDITSIRVLNSTGTVIENSDGTVNDTTIGITFVNGVATITGIKAGYAIEYTTTLDHNRVLIENGAALTAKGNEHADFDIDGLHLFQASITKAEIGSQMIFEDDGPAATGTAVAGTVDEDGLANGIPGGTGDVTGEATTASGSVTGIFQSGVDTPLSYALSSDTTGLPALSSGGVALVYSVVGNTLTAKAGAGGADVFTFSLTAAGAYTFTLLKPLDHAAGNNENDITINLGSLLRATDKDGDTVTAAAEKLVITVDDDTPTATGTAVTGTVDEDGLTNGIAGGVGDVAGVATTASGSVTGIFQSGADTPLSYALSTDTSGLQALSSGGVALVYSVAGDTLTAKAGVGGADVFTFSLTAAGAYSFTLLKPLDHAAGNDENDITINLGSLLRATDKDGDTVTAAADRLVITVDDDTPTATGTAVTGTVDEDGLANGNTGGTGDVTGEATIAGGSVTGIFQSGADTPLSYALSSVTSGLPALSSAGVALVYSVAGDTLTAKAGVGGADVFTFSLTSAGVYSFTLLKQLDHAAGDNENDIIINLGTLVQATDKDGDTVTAAADKLVITVDDDTPVIGTAPVQDVDPDLGATSWTFTGDFAYSIGADKRGPIYSSAADSDFANLALTGSANNVAIVDPTVTWASENLDSATFNVSFKYDHDRSPGTDPELVEGTLVFDKVNDTYTFAMDPLQTTQDVTLGEGTGYQTYDVGGTSPSSGPSPVATGKLGEGFYIQITGFESPLSAGGNTGVVDGETVSGTQAPVTLSSTALGVSGNTIQAGEAANINFFQTDPKGDLGADDFSYATDFFIKFDGYETESDDLVLIVSLADANDSSITTTRAIYVDQGDVYENDTNNADLVGTKYEALIANDPADPNDPFLDNNDALLIVESNDFNTQIGDNWLIKGIQILSNDAGLTGSAINLNRDVGADGGSSTSAQPIVGLVGPGNTIAEDTSTNPLKIIDAGFSTTTTTPATLDLTLDFQVVDRDSDFTAVQTIDIENPVIELVGVTNLAPTDLVL